MLKFQITFIFQPKHHKLATYETQGSESYQIEHGFMNSGGSWIHRLAQWAKASITSAQGKRLS